MSANASIDSRSTVGRPTVGRRVGHSLNLEGTRCVGGASVACWWLLWALWNFSNAKPTFPKLNWNVFDWKLSLGFELRNVLLTAISFFVSLEPKKQLLIHNLTLTTEQLTSISRHFNSSNWSFTCLIVRCYCEQVCGSWQQWSDSVVMFISSSKEYWASAC